MKTVLAKVKYGEKWKRKSKYYTGRREVLRKSSLRIFGKAARQTDVNIERVLQLAPAYRWKGIQ